jgi:fibronectin type III domain protein
MKRLLMFIVPAVLVLGALGVAVAATRSDEPGGAEPAACDTEPVPFEDATLIVEINATDGDAGLQPFLDHEPWRSIAIYRPDGSELFHLDTAGVLAGYGLTELFSESSEPPFTEFPLAEFQRLFPEGDYVYEGCTIEGQTLRSTVTLTHAFPEAPEILSPAADATVAAADVVVRWAPVTNIQIARYQVLVIDEEQDPPQELSALLPATATEFPVPVEFLTPGAEYKVEVLAIEAGGNQTLSELTFVAG